MNRSLLSIVIPAYEEEVRLQGCLQTLDSFFRGEEFEIETLVVDDGSRDATAEVARDAAGSLPEMGIRLLQNSQNRGKGESVRLGILAARGNFALVTDADLSTPIEEFAKLYEAVLGQQADIAIGSRDLPESDVQVRQSNVRERSGKVFNLLVRLLLGVPFRDTQCGFKLFRTPVCRQLFEKQSVSRYSFDVEILLLARQAGLRVVEVPVVWRHDRGSRIRFFEDGSRMILDLGKIVLKYWSGVYRH